MKKRGRPPILQNKEVIDKIIANIRAGYFVETAAALAGISKSTFHQWLKLAKDARKKEKKTTLEVQMIEFADQVMAARAEAEKMLIDRIDRSPKWEAAAWRLEKLFPDKYTDRKVLDANIKGDMKTTHNLTDKQLKALGDALANSPGDISPG